MTSMTIALQNTVILTEGMAEQIRREVLTAVQESIPTAQKTPSQVVPMAHPNWDKASSFMAPPSHTQEEQDVVME